VYLVPSEWAQPFVALVDVLLGNEPSSLPHFGGTRERFSGKIIVQVEDVGA